MELKPFFNKPQSSEPVLTESFESSALPLSRQHNRRFREKVHSRAVSTIVGNSVAICKLRAYLRKVALTDSHVLITGETGTGKDLAAQYIHEHSARRAKPLITINCAALPDGLFESELFGYERGAFTGAVSSYAGKLMLADGGTVLFDEIGEMSPYAQAKLLRVIETKEIFPLGARRSLPVDIRIIAATHRNVDQESAGSEFRRDLYFRLNVARIDLSPLRQRTDDLPLLIEHFVELFTARSGHNIAGFTAEAMDFLKQYDWPGNVRELMNLIERIFIDPPSGKITLSDLPETMLTDRSARQDTAPQERELLLYALSQTNWNKSEAAERLQWSRPTLYRKLAKYQIDGRKPDSSGSLISFAHRCSGVNARVTKV